MRTPCSALSVALSTALAAVALATFASATPASGAEATDASWPMWRYDAGRTASTPHELPERLRLAWTRQLPAPAPAWPWQEDDSDKLAYDLSYEAVAGGGLLYVPSMARDRVTAYDAATGEEAWRFYADGPVRFAPALAEERLYFVSDDGYLYCLDARSGKLRWRFRGGPTPRRVLGNGRLIDAWPARGGPAVADGTVYFAAGIWPSTGVFVHAVDAETGERLWTHSGSGAHFAPQIHQSAGSHSGPSPQGYLAVAGDWLLVAAGRSRPAAFRRSTGEFRYFNLVPRPWDRYPGMGGYAVMAHGEHFHVHGEVGRLEDGEPLVQLGTPQFASLSAGRRLMNTRAIRSIDALPPGDITVLNGREWIGAYHGRITAYSDELDSEEVQMTDRRGNETTVERHSLHERWSLETDPPLERVFLQAGSRLYGSGPEGAVLAVRLPEGDATESPETEVIGHVEGRPWSMLAAENRLFVVTEEGRFHCFAGGEGPAETLAEPETGLPEGPVAGGGELAAVAIGNGAREGWALVIGEGGATEQAAIETLLSDTELKVVALLRDPEQVEALRRRFDDAGLYGERVAVHPGDPLEVELPPYFAEWILVEGGIPGDLEDQDAAAWLARVFESLRPYGGTALLPPPGDEAGRERLAVLIEAAGLENAELGFAENYASLVREGPLPGAGEWTHQNGDPANTLVSAESRIRPPFGVLWFGGPSNADVLPRHGRGPNPQVAGGRLFILGAETLSARDVYTGRTLWTRSLPGIGAPYNTTSHQPGADHVGSPYVSLAEAVYVRHEGRVLELDPATGETRREFHPGGPVGDGEEAPPLGYLGVWEDLLVVGSGAQQFDDTRPGHPRSWNATSSARLVVMDRRSGETLWEREAEHGFRHNAIAASEGRLYLVDRLSDGAIELLQRRGQTPEGRPCLMALDARNGEEIWSTGQDVFGTWLGYSAEHDVLLQGLRPPVDGRQALEDEPRPATRLIAYRGSDGEPLWEQDFSYRNACLIHGDKIIVYGDIYDLHTGEPRVREHPVTGEEIPWTYAASSNCGQIVGSEHLLTFRRGTASYYDLSHAGGTGDIGGFRAGCTPNLIPADGVLNIPDYTRTCVCQYPFQTSLALVHRPESEQWVVDSLRPTGAPVRRIGVNLGARGHRIDGDGTYWMAYPPIHLIGGTSEEVSLREQSIESGRGTAAQIDLEISPEHPGWTRFYGHSSLVGGEGPAWVAASGIEGLDSVELALGGDGEARRYTVRLHFAEPSEAAPGERAFDVFVQGDLALEGLDPAAEAGAPKEGMVKQIDGVEVAGRLLIELRASEGSARPPLLCGVEVIEEGEK